MAFSVTRASRAETEELNGDKLETSLLRCKDFSAGAAGRRSCGTARCTRLAGGKERCDPDKPLFDDNIYQRGEALVLKPASNGTGFEADRGACGTLKYRCPAAAFGMRRAGEPSASTSMTVGFSRQPLGAALRGSAASRSALERKPGRQRLRRNTTFAACGRLRPGLVTVAAMALGSLRAERACGRWLARSGCATDRCGRPTAPCNWLPAATARLAPGLRRSAAATSYSPFVLKIERPHGPCRPVGGRAQRTAGVSASRRAEKTAQRKRLTYRFEMMMSIQAKMRWKLGPPPQP